MASGLDLYKTLSLLSGTVWLFLRGDVTLLCITCSSWDPPAGGDGVSRVFHAIQMAHLAEPCM
ncbi:hypothetical protein JZ751_028378 [Albula glossodonta]|uniref:Uncharacterized protein n=1 Tax=Albula glossodonta TaxID=121402 RepID=A0A8T2NFB8_9TELE|nr:hypothetical protein JZ751_028378 [Albula glossodonta]